MSVSSLSIGAVILAAGESSRLGQLKQKIRYRGESLLRRACHAALETGCAPVIVMLGAHRDVLSQELFDLPVHIAMNAEWREGLGSSIRSGVQAILESEPAAQATLLTLVDQPLIAAPQLHRLIDVFAGMNNPIVASQYDVKGERVRGVPALFSFELFPDLLRLHGCQGAKGVISEYEACCSFVLMPEAAEDIDTPADLEAWIQSSQHRER